MLHTHRAGSLSSCSLKGTPAVPCPQSAPTTSLPCPSPRSSSANQVPHTALPHLGGVQHFSSQKLTHRRARLVRFLHIGLLACHRGNKAQRSRGLMVRRHRIVIRPSLPLVRMGGIPKKDPEAPPPPKSCQHLARSEFHIWVLFLSFNL